MFTETVLLSFLAGLTGIGPIAIVFPKLPEKRQYF
jgi:hypothetical protein